MGCVQMDTGSAAGSLDLRHWRHATTHKHNLNDRDGQDLASSTFKVWKNAVPGSVVRRTKQRQDRSGTWPDIS